MKLILHLGLQLLKVQTKKLKHLKRLSTFKRPNLYKSQTLFSYLSIRLNLCPNEKVPKVFSLNLNSKDTRDNCSPAAIQSKRRFAPFSQFFGILARDRQAIVEKNRWLKFNFGTIGRSCVGGGLDDAVHFNWIEQFSNGYPKI